MAKSIESYRILKKDSPDPEKIRRTFEGKSSTEIVAALANPEHSPRAIEMLSEIARERGIQTGEDRLWAQSRSTMHVAPFGKQPTFAEALAAPTPHGAAERTYVSQRRPSRMDSDAPAAADSDCDDRLGRQTRDTRPQHPPLLLRPASLSLAS